MTAPNIGRYLKFVSTFVILTVLLLGSLELAVSYPKTSNSSTKYDSHNVTITNGTKNISNTIVKNESRNLKVSNEQMFSSADASEPQQWINQETNTKIKFIYFPAVPMIGNSTKLGFVVEDLKTGNSLKNLSVGVTILADPSNSNGGDNLTLGADNLSSNGSNDISMANLHSSNGDFFIKHKFLKGGMYQVIVRVSSDQYALALASFNMYII